MTYKKSKSAWDNYQEIWKDLNKSKWTKCVFIILTNILKRKTAANYTHIYIFIYIYIYKCVYVLIDRYEQFGLVSFLCLMAYQPL